MRCGYCNSEAKIKLTSSNLDGNANLIQFLKSDRLCQECYDNNRKIFDKEVK